METLLGVVAALAATILLVRTLREREDRRRRPGGSAATAVPIAQFGEIDAIVATQRCTCRGRFAVRGEGPLAAEGTIRQVRLECRECGRERLLFFDMAGIEHALGEV